MSLMQRRPAAARRRTFKEVRTHRGLQACAIWPLATRREHVFAFRDSGLVLGDGLSIAERSSDLAGPVHRSEHPPVRFDRLLKAMASVEPPLGVKKSGSVRACKPSRSARLATMENTSPRTDYPRLTGKEIRISPDSAREGENHAVKHQVGDVPHVPPVLSARNRGSSSIQSRHVDVVLVLDLPSCE